MKTTLCYLERDGKFLMLFRNKKNADISEGKWLGIGGKFEPGETGPECLVREVAEETGFKLNSWVDHGIVYFVHNIHEDEEMYLYTSDDFEVPAGTPLVDGLPVPPCSEGTLAWIPTSEVCNLNMWEGDRIFLPMLAAGQVDCTMTLRYEGDSLVEYIPGH